MGELIDRKHDWLLKDIHKFMVLIIMTPFLPLSKSIMIKRNFDLLEGLIRVLMALATTNDFDVHQMDVRTTFLNGYLQKTIYMEQPQGFIQPGTHHKVYKLHMIFYGFT
jgi:hypothetical protein